MRRVGCEHTTCDWAYFLFSEDDSSIDCYLAAYEQHCETAHRGRWNVPEYDDAVDEQLDSVIDKYTPGTTGRRRENQRTVLRIAAQKMRRREQP